MECTGKVCFLFFSCHLSDKIGYFHITIVGFYKGKILIQSGKTGQGILSKSFKYSLLGFRVYITVNL